MTIQIKQPGGTTADATSLQLAQIRSDLDVPSKEESAAAVTVHATTNSHPTASQAEAVAGLDNAKFMTALRVAQAFAALVPAGLTGAQIVEAINTVLGGPSWQGGAMTGATIVSAIDAVLGSTTWQNGGGGGSTPIINDLVTGGSTSALAAAQGVALKALVDTKQANLAVVDNTALLALIDSRANTRIAVTVGAAPGALDTLVELATALGNDANFAATMTAALAAKAPLASPAFTGAPTAPTPAAGTDSTVLATTAFVAAAVRDQSSPRTVLGTPAANNSYVGQATQGPNAAAGGLTQWQAVYITAAGTTAVADANGSGTFPCVGIVTAAVAAGAVPTILDNGIARNDAWTWTPGGKVYLSGTAGTLTQTAPATAGDNVQCIGYARTATTIRVNVGSGEYLTRS